MFHRELSAIVAPSQASYSERFPRELLDQMMYAADPPADKAIGLIHEERYATGAGNLELLRALAEQGDDVAQAFFAHSEAVPSWVDWDQMASGQRVALAHLELYGASLLHNLFAGSVFMRATQVIAATGRIGADPTRRIRETSGFVVSVLSADGVRPGSEAHAIATRVRLLHSSIRHWFTASFDFDTPYTGVPIDQVALAMTLGLFSHQNIRNLLRLGVPLSGDDIAGHHMLWRYVGYLLGIDESLLTESAAEEAELWSAIVAHQAFPELLGPRAVDRMIEFMTSQMEVPRKQANKETLARSVLEHLSGPEILGVESLDGNRIARLAFTSIGFGLGSVYRWVPTMDHRLVQRGLRLSGGSADAGREHDFGVEIDTEESEAEERERYEHTLEIVAQRFDRS